MTRKWYATLRHPKMYPHTKFGIPTSKNIGDMDRTRKRDGRTDGRTDGLTDGRTDGRTDSAITICLPKFLWGHKNIQVHHQSVKWFGSRSGPTFCRSCCVSTLFAKIINTQQKWLLTRKEHDYFSQTYLQQLT